MPAVAIPREGRHAVRAQEPQTRGQLVVVGHDHAALSDRQVLVREEAETADVARACRTCGRSDLPPARGPRPRPRRGHDAPRPRRSPPCRTDSRRSAGRPAPSCVGVTAASTSAGSRLRSSRADDVAEDRLGARVLDRVRRRDEVQRRHHHLVAGATADCEQREVERCGAVGDRDRVLGAAERGELALELLDPRPHAPPAGADNLEHGLDELVVDDHVGERDAPAGLGHLPILTEPSARATSTGPSSRLMKARAARQGHHPRIERRRQERGELARPHPPQALRLAPVTCEPPRVAEAPPPAAELPAEPAPPRREQEHRQLSAGEDRPEQNQEPERVAGQHEDRAGCAPAARSSTGAGRTRTRGTRPRPGRRRRAARPDGPSSSARRPPGT